MFSTVIFSPEEARRALVICADSEEPLDEEELFTPERGASLERWGPAHGVRAATLREGRCSFLEGSGRCRLHRLGGPGGKPAGCALYPLLFVDDGEVIRVSLRPECACVFEQLKRQGEPLLPPAMRCGGDLPLVAHVAILPREIAISSTATRSREALRRWSRSALAAFAGSADRDLVATLLSLSDRLEMGSLETTLPCDGRRGAGELGERLHEELAELHEAVQVRARLLASWLTIEAPARRALEAIGGGCEELLCAGAPRHPRAGDRRDELLYGRLFFFGHQWHGEAALARELRLRALRVMLARTAALRETYSAQEHPLAVVEAALRGTSELSREASVEPMER